VGEKTGKGENQFPPLSTKRTSFYWNGFSPQGAQSLKTWDRPLNKNRANGDIRGFFTTKDTIPKNLGQAEHEGKTV
jgi:hypothetical protein